MLYNIFKTTTLYFVILIIVRIMGKREIGKLSPFDLVVAIMIAELAVFPIEEKDLSLIDGLVPILVVAGLEILLAVTSLKSIFLRGVINGKPEILIENGDIIYENLKKTKYNMNDLLLQLRKKDVFDIEEVEIALLETSGDLTVLKKDDKNYSFPVIIDGKLSSNTRFAGVTENWVRKRLKNEDVEIKNVALAVVNNKKKIKLYFKKKQR